MLRNIFIIIMLFNLKAFSRMSPLTEQKTPTIKHRVAGLDNARAIEHTKVAENTDGSLIEDPISQNLSGVLIGDTAIDLTVTKAEEKKSASEEEEAAKSVDNAMKVFSEELNSALMKEIETEIAKLPPNSEVRRGLEKMIKGGQLVNSAVGGLAKGPYLIAVFLTGAKFSGLIEKINKLPLLGPDSVAFRTVNSKFIAPLKEGGNKLMEIMNKEYALPFGDTNNKILDTIKITGKTVAYINTVMEATKLLVNIGGCLSYYAGIGVGSETTTLPASCRPGLASYFAFKAAFALGYMPGVRKMFALYDTVFQANYGQIKDFDECLNNKDDQEKKCNFNYTSVYFEYEKNGERTWDWLKVSPDEDASYFQLFGYWTWKDDHYVFVAPGEELAFVYDLVKKQILAKEGSLQSVRIRVADGSFSLTSRNNGYAIFFANNLQKQNLIKQSVLDIKTSSGTRLSGIPGIWFLNGSSSWYSGGSSTFLITEDSYLAAMAAAGVAVDTKTESDTVLFGTNQLMKYQDTALTTTWFGLEYPVIIVKDYPNIEDYYSKYWVRKWFREKGIGTVTNSFGIFF